MQELGGESQHLVAAVIAEPTLRLREPLAWLRKKAGRAEAVEGPATWLG